MAKTKKTTIEDLARMITSSAKGLDKVIEKTDLLADKVDKNLEDTDSLARMVKNGFDDMGGKIEKIQTDIELLKQGEERIELRLTNDPYRFEVVDLRKRVLILEEKVGIKSGK